MTRLATKSRRTDTRASGPAGAPRGGSKSRSRGGVRAPRSYLYLANKPGGGRSAGVRQATSPRALASDLRRERLILTSSIPLPGGGQAATKIPLKDEAQLNIQLSQLVSRGVPLVEALRVAEGVVSPPTRPIVSRLAELVQAGDGFAEACEKVGCFDIVAKAVYKAAEQTGDLGGACRELAETAKRRLAISSKVVTALGYPVVVATIGLMAGAFLLGIVVPRIGDALQSALGDRPLPWYTQAVLTVGRFLQSDWPIVVVVVGLVIGAAVVFRAPVAQAGLMVLRRLPLVNQLMRAQERARFLTVMSSLTAAGVPLADALGVGVPTVRDPALHKQLTKLRSRLIEGGVFPRLIDDVDAMPEPTRRLLIAADRAGDLETAFGDLAEDATEEVATRSERLVGFIEPLMIVLLFLVIGTIVLSIMIPLMTLPSQITGG